MSGTRDPGAEAGPLLDPGRRGADYKKLAGNLISLDGPPANVAVTGAEEGAGCSSVCLGLGGALASMGLHAAVVDCNLDRPRLHKMVGGPNFTGLTTALDGDGEPEGYGYEPAPGLLVVPTGPIPENAGYGLPRPEALARVLAGLRRSRDLVLLDAPRVGETLESDGFFGGFDGVLLVIHASRTAKGVARDAADGLADAGANLLGVVLNGGS